jgi:hypothetical protein
MISGWLPRWLALGWTFVFALILLVHLWHLLVLSGRQRLWHGVHVLMATGMIAMTVPATAMRLPIAGAAVFGAAAALIGCLLTLEGAGGDRIGPLWVAATIDLAAMAYMFAMTSAHRPWISAALAAWFVLQALGWASGRLSTVLAANGLGRRAQLLPVAAVGVTATGAGATTPVSAPDDPGEPAPLTGPRGHRAAHHVTVRASLALMSTGMAYMLVIMQWAVMVMAPHIGSSGSPAMPAMPGR